MNAIRRLLRQHPLSVACYAVFLLLCFNFLRARNHYTGLYGADGQMNAVPLERTFHSLVFVIAAALVLLLIAVAKIIFEKEGKRYYFVYSGLIVIQLILLWVYAFFL